MALLLVLLIAGGLGAGWWVLNRPRPVPPADPGAVEDVEVISEGLDASREEPREAQPTNGGESPVESGPTTTPGFPPDGQPGDLVPPSPLPGDTQAADTLPPGTGTAPTPDPAATPTPADTGRTPPRVIGVPVDSARSPPQSAGNRSTEPPPASVVPIAA